MLPMHHRTGIAGVLMLTNANGRADCGTTISSWARAWPTRQPWPSPTLSF